MKIAFGIICFSLLALGARAQNLVPNSSFEQYDQCPWTLGIWDAFVTHWFNPTMHFPAYFNACSNVEFPCEVGVPCNGAGYQPARTGGAYAGLVFYFNPELVGVGNKRTYIEIRLVEPLVKDTLYCAEFFVSLCGDNWNMLAVANAGMYFSSDSIYDQSNDTLSYIPQIASDPSVFLLDTVNWMRIGGSFTAQGGECFLTIGNFLPDDQTNVINNTSTDAFYYVDDVSVIKCSQATPIHVLPVSNVSFSIYPNPANTSIRVEYAYKATAAYELRVLDIAGRTVQVARLSDERTVDVSSLQNGAYLVVLEENGKRVAETKLVILN